MAASTAAGPRPGASSTSPGATNERGRPAPVTSGIAQTVQSAAPSGLQTAAANPSAQRPVSGPSPAPGGARNVDKLNDRLNAMLPQGTPIAYSDKHYQNTLTAAVEQAQTDYYRAAAPPPDVLAKVIKIVKQRGTLLGPASIVYILKRQRIFGIEICTGWKIEQAPGGGPPQGGYTFGACGGEEFAPSGGLPTAPPKSGT